MAEPPKMPADIVSKAAVLIEAVKFHVGEFDEWGTEETEAIIARALLAERYRAICIVKAWAQSNETRWRPIITAIADDEAA